MRLSNGKIPLFQIFPIEMPLAPNGVGNFKNLLKYAFAVRLAKARCDGFTGGRSEKRVSAQR